MRAFGFAALALAGTTMFFACDSFEESSTANDAGGATDTGIEPTSDASTGADSTPGCNGEPEWKTTASGDPMATCNGMTVNLLTDSAHCGRCNHACAPETCVEGTCVEHREDETLSIPSFAHEGALHYVSRPAGAGHRAMRLVPGKSAEVLAALDVDSGEKEILAAAPGSDGLYVRTVSTLRRASLTTPSNAVPPVVATLSSEFVSALVAGPDRVYAGANADNRIVQILPDGGVSMFIPAVHPGELAISGNRFVWLSQPFLFIAPGTVELHVQQGAIDAKPLESSSAMGGLSVIGDEAYVIRTGSPGAIVRVDIASGTTTPIYTADFPNPATELATAVDESHVYWFKSLDGFGSVTEIWKRARCGGASVRIGKHAYPYKLVALGGRLYYGAPDGLWSIAK